MMDSDSETNLIIASRAGRLKLFCMIYWRSLIVVITPLILMPVAFIKTGNACICLYIFITIAVYWISDALHPAVISLIPLSVAALVEMSENSYVSQVFGFVGLINTLEAMILIVAEENSRIQRRIALKVLLIFGCSHYRLSFLLFFSTAFLSMWIPNIIACGLMIPLVSAILEELEKMGILDVYHSVDTLKLKQLRHGQSHPIPTSFSVFYFLGIAYSASIGGMCTLVGSEMNAIFKHYCELTFPLAPKILFPHFMLLNLPGVLMMETLLYLWMNFYFLGLFRAQSEIALEIGLTEEETQFINNLLATSYRNMGRINFHEIVVGFVLVLTVMLHIPMTVIALEDEILMAQTNRHQLTATTTMICVVMLFVLPTDLKFLNFIKKRHDDTILLPTMPSRACISWRMVRENVYWSVLFIIGGSCCLFHSIQTSGASQYIDQILMTFSRWPVELQVLVVIILCKVLTEFGPNSCVLYAVLPSVARMSLASEIHPHHLMLGAALGSSLPFHLVCGSPNNALVAAYIHLPPWKMMSAGVGPSIISILITWFSVAVWSKAIWNDAHLFPEWAKNTTLF